MICAQYLTSSVIAYLLEAGATSFLCFTNTMRIDFDTEVAETRAKPNRPSGERHGI